MSIDNPIIYKQLLQRHGHIRIPMIQRDYAQGRPTERAVRELFLGAMEEALRKPADDPTLPLNLDFIYGSVEGNEKRRFLPLDGQQRLTTLFLLHWYLAWRDDQWPRFEEMFLNDRRSRFAYEVRPSSSGFFDQLVNYRPGVTPEKIREGKLSELITDQPWYFRNWRLDPTIQSVLCMLDAIHQRFATAAGLFSRLVDDAQPAITFQLLDLENFGLSDDLYIKMNARGKPLTAFETFKARYEQELKSQLTNVTFKLGGLAFDAADYVERRMDTAWTDLFWKHRDSQSHLYDDALMCVFRAVALITRQVDGGSYLDNVKLLRDADNPPSYADFHAHGWLDEPFTLGLIRLLDAWSADGGALTCFLPDTRFFDEQAFFSRVTTNPATLSYAEVIQFAAYVRFIATRHDAIDPAAFQEWIRVIFNLSTNTIYNRGDDFQRSMRALDGLLENADNILLHFVGAERVTSGFNEQQMAEEKLKAGLFLADSRWRELIDRAEGHGYFRGQIGFLLDFCGVTAAASETAPDGWDAATHTALQEHFARYLALAEKMFTDAGLADIKPYRWQRALLSLGNYLLPSGRNDSFLVNSATDEASWKRLLRGYGAKLPEARVFLQQLWDRLNPDEELAPQLDSIIDTSGEMEAWRKAIVRYPAAIAYCDRFNIRWRDSDTLYLLKRTQLNGAHAEVFTYCLYQDLKRPENHFTVIKPLYFEATDTSWDPHVRLNCNLRGKEVGFTVFDHDGGYLILVDKDDCDDIAGLIDTLQVAGYTETEKALHNLVSGPDILAHIRALDTALTSQVSGIFQRQGD